MTISKRLERFGIAALLVLTAAGATALATTPTTGDPVQELLSGVDFVPGRDGLDAAAGGQAEADLLDLARAESDGHDPGIRLRAIRALALYPGSDAATALEQVIADNADGEGLSTLYTRAALMALAEVDGSAAVGTIAAQLDHPVLDVRATAARALAATDAATAVAPLRERLGEEKSPQVRLAISSAIRQLTGVPIPQ